MSENVSTPEWLTKDYFQSLFERESAGAGVTIKNLTVKFTDAERIHGNLVRAVVELRTPDGEETRSYIVKTGIGEFFKTPPGVNMFRVESFMLDKIIPAMETKLKEISQEEFVPLAPRLIDYGFEENLFLLEEDLSAMGFKVASRRKGLDLSHSLVYAKYLAAFHAASVAVLDQFKLELLSIPLLVDSKEVESLNGFIDNSVKCVAKEVETWDNGSEYLEKIRRIGKDLPKRLAEANHYRPGKLNVICHGDMFINNILFKDSKVRLIDFQLSRVGSFADDITGFVHSCLNEDTLRDHWEDIIEEYRKNLNSFLEQLGFADRQLTKEDVQEELRLQKAVTLFGAFHMLPHSRTPGDIDLETGTTAFSAPDVKRVLRLLIPRFQENGLLDV